ncbi:MAG: hypothetical protein WBG10_13195 [Pseudolabrys sp.]
MPIKGPAMKSFRVWQIVERAYDDVKIALYAALFAFVVYFAAFIIPNLPAIGAQNQIIRVKEIAMENASICEKLGMNFGNEKYNQCLLDVAAFRLKVETRIYEAFY